MADAPTLLLSNNIETMDNFILLYSKQRIQQTQNLFQRSANAGGAAIYTSTVPLVRTPPANRMNTSSPHAPSCTLPWVLILKTLNPRISTYYPPQTKTIANPAQSIPSPCPHSHPSIQRSALNEDAPSRQILSTHPIFTSRYINSYHPQISVSEYSTFV